MGKERGTKCNKKHWDNRKRRQEDNDKPTIVALREIEEGLLDNETLEEWLKDDILSDGFSAEPISQEGENIG